MQVICTQNNRSILPKKLQKFAFGITGEPLVDLSVGKIYTSYGIRENNLGRFYWVLTDEVNTELPWWMPAAFFEVVDSSEPSTWKLHQWKGYGKEVVRADPLHSKYSEDIEDGTDKGYVAFEKIRKEPDFLALKFTAKNLLQLLEDPKTAALNIHWDDLLSSKEAFTYIIKNYTPEFSYLLGEGVVFSEYDRELLIETLEKKARS